MNRFFEVIGTWRGAIRKRAALQIDNESLRGILRLVDKEAPGAILLDVGCGKGDLTLSIAQAVKAQEVFGIDIVEQCVEEAKQKGIKAVHGDLVQPFPFEDESIDMICAARVIEHLSDTDMFVRECYRVLKPGGALILNTPNLASLYVILCLLLGKQPPSAMVSDRFTISGEALPQVEGFRAHRRLFTREGLRNLLSWYGFSLEKTISFGYHPFPNPFAKVLCAVDRWHAAYIGVRARKPRKGSRYLLV